MQTENLRIAKQHTAVRAENSRLHAEISSFEGRVGMGSVVSKLESDIVLLQRQIELHKQDVKLTKEANTLQLDNAWANRWSWMDRSVDTKVAIAMEEQLVLTMTKLEGLSHSIANRMRRKLLPFLFKVRLGFFFVPALSPCNQTVELIASGALDGSLRSVVPSVESNSWWVARCGDLRAARVKATHGKLFLPSQTKECCSQERCAHCKA